MGRLVVRGDVLRSLTFSKFVRVRREPFAIRATHRLLCGERKARRGGSVDCNEQNCCSAADGESPPCALKWAKMLFCARFRAFCSLLPRQAGRFRAEQVPHGLRRLRRGREELYCAFQLGEGRDGRDVSYVYQRIQTCILEIHAWCLHTSGCNWSVIRSLSPLPRMFSKSHPFWLDRGCLAKEFCAKTGGFCRHFSLSLVWTIVTVRCGGFVVGWFCWWLWSSANTERKVLNGCASLAPAPRR